MVFYLALFPSILPMPRNKITSPDPKGTAEGQRNSHGEHTGRVPNQAVGRPPRDPGSGVGSKSAIAHLLAELTSGRALDLDQAATAGDRSVGRKAFNTVEGRNERPTRRVEGPDSSDLFNAETASPFLPDVPLPSPYKGRSDQRAFDLRVYKVTVYTKHYELSNDQMMCKLHRLVSENALLCSTTYFPPSCYHTS